MVKDFPLFPEAASTIAPKMDAFYIGMVVICGLVALGVVALIFIFGVKYRRKHQDEHPVSYKENVLLELGWIVIPTIIFMGMFLFGARLFFDIVRPPKDAMDVYVTGKQWMWKFQHVGGQSQINELNVPVGRPVRLIMASEDVLHDFYVPEFRVHTDVLPNRYTYSWFQATKPGRYHIFCSEYCGTWHSQMVGWVNVYEPDKFQAWLNGGASEVTPAAEGEKLFQRYACNTCHMPDASGRGPSLVGIYGKSIQLNNNQVVNADENYIRESILNPQTKIVAGYDPVMPSFEGQVDETQLIQLLTYIKSQAGPVGSPSQQPGGPAQQRIPPATEITNPAQTGTASANAPATQQ